jgi:hypothetical protein
MASSAPASVSNTPNTGVAPGPAIDDPEAQMQAACAPWVAIQPPGTDVPTASERAALHGCDDEAAYYGIDQSVDYRKARLCAFTHAALNLPKGDFYTSRCLDCAGVIEGPAILMMIYANGRGVPVNFELALRFACDVASTPAELSFRLGRLSARHSGALDKPLEYCDDITSGYDEGVCGAHAERIAAVPRRARLDAVSKLLPQQELGKLLNTAKLYFDAREANEVDLTGTARALFQIQERAKLEDDLVQTLEQLASRSFSPPKADAATELALSAKLPRSRDCKPEPEPTFVGMPTCAGMLEAQRAWVPYRRAFVALARQARPDVSQPRWSSWIIRQRLEQLGR